MKEISIIDYVNKQIQETPTVLAAKTQDILGYPYPTRNIFVKVEQYVRRHLMTGAATDARWIVVPGLRGVGKSTLLAQT